jgi:hypothetical protein
MFKRILILLIFPAVSFGQLIPEGEIPFGAYSTHAANSGFYGNQQLEVMHDSLGINQFTCGGFYDTTAQRFAQNGIFVYPWGTYSNGAIEAQTQYAGATYFICHPESSAYYHVTFQTRTGGPFQDTLWASAVPGVMLGDLYGLYTNRYDWLAHEQLRYSCYLKMGIEETGLDTNTAVAVFKVTSIFDTLGQVRLEDTIRVKNLAVGHDTLAKLWKDRNLPSAQDYFTAMDSQTSDKSKQLRFDLINLGNATVYVDYFRVNCQYGEQLINPGEPGQFDNQIKQSAGRAGYDGSILGWFIKDIQYIGNHRPFAYIDSLIAETTSTWTHPVRAASHVVPQSGNGYRIQDAGDGYRDFWRISRQREMWSFLYPLTSRTNYSGYSSEWDAWNTHLQRGLNFYLADMCDSIRAAMTSCDSCSWMFVPEYWYCDSTDADPCYGSEQRRKPTESELRAMTYIGLCYHPKGIMFYKYDSYPGDAFTKGIVDSIGNPRPGMYNVIKDDISPYLKAIGSVYMGLTWQRAYAYNENYSKLPPGVAYVSSISFRSDTCYSALDEQEDCNNPDAGWFHVGEFTDSIGTPYIMLVNRACSDNYNNPAPPVTATVKFNPSTVGSNYVLITDLADSVRHAGGDTGWVGIPKTTYSAKMPDGTIPYTITLRAGQGRLIKIAKSSKSDILKKADNAFIRRGEFISN